jgi:two-component system chemotaxis sensor kinase CheA
MIEDKELSDLFKIESEEHLNAIENGLLSIEQNPKDYEVLHVIFREAHSMKGASRMLGVSDAETISHILEDQLGKASRGELELNSSIIDRFYVGIDAIRKIVDEAITGHHSYVNVLDIVDILNGKSEITRPRTKKEPIKTESKKESTELDPIPNQTLETHSEDSLSLEDKTESEIPPKQNENSSEPMKKPITQNEEIGTKTKIESMRVDPSKLDVLMVQTGELTVAKNRITNRVKEIDNILNQFSESNKSLVTGKKLLQEITSLTQINQPIKPYLLKDLEEFFNLQREKMEHLGDLLLNLKKTSTNDSTKLDLISVRIEDGIQNIRMLPLSTVFTLFNRTVRDLSRITGKEIKFVIDGADTTADKQIVEELKDPLMHLIQNAIDHGLETPSEREKAGKPLVGTLKLSGRSRNNSIIIELSDDGKGLNANIIKEKAIQKGLYSKEELDSMPENEIHMIIFQHGFSTRAEVSNLSGRGVGMDVVKTFVDNMKGTIEIESTKGIGTIFRIRLPIRFSTTHVLIAGIAGRKYAIPTEYVILSKNINISEIFTIEGKSTYLLGEEPISIVDLKDYLEIDSIKNATHKTISPCIFILSNSHKVGLIVDDVLDKQEVIMKPLGSILKKVRNVSGGTILESGEVCIILNPRDIMKSVLSKNIPFLMKKTTEFSTKKKVLVVDDSLTTRVQIKRILESANYEVTLSVDGREAFEKLQQKDFHAMVTDYEMPNLNGIELTKKVRKLSEFKSFPILILTSLGKEEHIKSGMEAGADAYLIKSNFDQNELLKTLKRLI